MVDTKARFGLDVCRNVTSWTQVEFTSTESQRDKCQYPCHSAPSATLLVDTHQCRPLCRNSAFALKKFTVAVSGAFPAHVHHYPIRDHLIWCLADARRFSSDQRGSLARRTQRAHTIPSSVPTRCSWVKLLWPSHTAGFPPVNQIRSRTSRSLSHLRRTSQHGLAIPQHFSAARTTHGTIEW